VPIESILAEQFAARCSQVSDPAIEMVSRKDIARSWKERRVYLRSPNLRSPTGTTPVLSSEFLQAVASVPANRTRRA
jgi:hypothetical protein